MIRELLVTLATESVIVDHGQRRTKSVIHNDYHWLIDYHGNQTLPSVSMETDVSDIVVSEVSFNLS
jgi:hypothetical protein